MDTSLMFGFARQPAHFVEVRNFGDNPAGLRMFTYVPLGLPEQAPLVVTLHGCRQNARAYGEGTGWTELAGRFGFALLLPEQAQANNLRRCFNWFDGRNCHSAGPEPLSLYQMIDWMLERHRLDRQRVFVTGLSAGGAMTSIMLAVYPEVFAGGAIIAGLPFGAAEDVMDALRVMAEGRSRTAGEWGALVRSAKEHHGPPPRVSVWHGSADERVHPSNAEEIVKQWADIHGLHGPPSADSVSGDGFHHRSWRNGAGQPVLESYTVFDMAHGAPISSEKDGPKAGGKFLIDVGISSSQRIATFWGLMPAEALPVRRPSLIARVLRTLGLRRN
jgi:feruloyl esterase